MFTQSCFIRKSSHKLRAKLQELGYRLFGAEMNEDLCIFTYPEHGLFWIEFFSNIPNANESEFIDCGTNEDLFLAIAALRDDTDINQWFVLDVEAYVDIHKGDWFKATDINGQYHVGAKIDPLYCHKATVEELIEHFTGLKNRE